LCINYPALKQDMMQAHHNGVGYKVIQGGAAMGYDELQLPFGSKPLLVVPVISGAGGGSTTQILLGVGLVALAIANPAVGFGLGGAAGFGAGAVAPAVAATLGASLTALGGNIGVALILGGTASLLSPQPQLANASANRIKGEGTNVRGPGPDGITRGAMGQANYAFTGPANTVGTGATVPVIYGRVIAGSHLLAANLEVSDDSDPLKTTTQTPGVSTFTINGDKVSQKLESHGGMKGRRTDKEFNSSDTDEKTKIVINESFGPSSSDDKKLEANKKLTSDTLKHRNDVRKKLDILFKINKGLFDFVADKDSTKIDGFIRYRITAEVTGKGDPDPVVASADVTVQGLLLSSHNIVYGHRLQMPEIKRDENSRVRVKVEIIDTAVHDNARLIFHAYGYGLLDKDD